MRLIGVLLAFCFAVTLNAGVITSVQCVVRDFSSPGSPVVETAQDGCRLGNEKGSLARAGASGSYSVEGNTFTMEMSATAVGDVQFAWPISGTVLGEANAIAEISGIWLYTEVAATISFFANPMVSASSNPWDSARAPMVYQVGQYAGYCGKHMCWGDFAADFVVEPGEAWSASASIDAVGHGDHFYGMGVGDGVLRLTAQAWAEDGSPAPLFLIDTAGQMLAPAALEDEAAIDTPEPATQGIIALGLMVLAISFRKLRHPRAQ